MKNATRKRIGSWSDIVTRQLVYETEHGIEVDEFDHFEIGRKRVFFDDVVLVTMHKELGTSFVVMMAILFLGFGILAAVSATILWLMLLFLFIAATTFVLAAIRLMLKIDIVTVSGRRSRAAIRYAYRKAFAQEIFDRICAKAAEAQARRAAEIAATEAPPIEAAVEEQPPAPPAIDEQPNVAPPAE